VGDPCEDIMNSQINCNCIICAEEFDPTELQSIVLSKINITRFKICESCLNKSDPTADYQQVKNIVDSYLRFAEARQSLIEIKSMLKSVP